MIGGIVDAIESVSGGSLYIAAVLAGSICAALTFIGALPAALGARSAGRMLDVGLGFSAGVMLVASFTSLILPGIELGGLTPVLLGFALGSATIFLINKYLPHEHLVKGFEGPEELGRRLRTVWLLVFAIIIHNFPEGLAVGASVSYSVREGVLMAIAIGLQDMPEGFAVAMPLVGMGMGVGRALGIALLSGLTEVAMAVVPVAATSASRALLPAFLGFAGGSMIYVVSHEVIPETHRHGREDVATLGLLIGFIVMLVLDTMLG